MPRISIVVGNPKPRSRTLKICIGLAARLAAGPEVVVDPIDLIDFADGLMAWPNPKMQEVLKSVASADLVIVGSPTYKASFTGLLKMFLDRYPARGLDGVTCIALMTGQGAAHSLAPNTALIPLLMELGANVPIPGFFFDTGRMDQCDKYVEESAAKIRAAFSKIKASAEITVDPIREPDANRRLIRRDSLARINKIDGALSAQEAYTPRENTLRGTR